ncbi:hypothetical protein HBHAL_4799 [Halobacillus halophilus DSM 2266]|uniref:Uncharacterized protein n=1 Tax=Halobacillus halophilus (strain ATCC 35676 / DSM 2266 / JCM 20832 / KCTC 3685 / LMG 17431 / NBRC 102448 / NCIMB 2269) TaxID=866895 RepID=I0JSL5_HALH3|nr:hypothetical protein HBHAL_4799 [Halobacillus halophilus DSM 2266]
MYGYDLLILKNFEIIMITNFPLGKSSLYVKGQSEQGVTTLLKRKEI